MLSLEETSQILTQINAHHGNARFEMYTVKLWQREILDTDVNEAMQAVSDWYATNTTGRWMLSGDLNQQIRANRAANAPTSDELDSEIQALEHTLERNLTDTERMYYIKARWHRGYTIDDCITAALDPTSPQHEKLTPRNLLRERHHKQTLEYLTQIVDNMRGVLEAIPEHHHKALESNE